MLDKDPLSYELLTYAWVILLSSWAGMSGYLRKIKLGYTRFSISELVGDVCISGFVGIVTFFLCESSKISPALSAALIGISAHMGSRAILGFEKIFEPIFNKWSGKDD